MLAEELRVEEDRSLAGGRSLVRHEPVGVVGAIVPWNAPQSLLSMKVGPALAAGCTIVVKPSPETSLDAFLFAEITESAGLPPGVVNVVSGGKSTGAALVANRGSDKISFTGSTLAGRMIATECARQLKPVSAELGGKSAAILLEDADLGIFEDSIIRRCLPYSGQVCFSCTRVLVDKGRYAEVLDLVVNTLGKAPIGDPRDPSTIFGPLVTSAQRDRVEAYIASGLKDGARLVLGGGRPADLEKGFYVEPSVFVDVDPEMTIFQEEIFGPVLVILPFDDEGSAVELANNSSYGLSGAVFGEDLERATDVARRLETGAVFVNENLGVPGLISPGQKNSGLGREGILETLGNYQVSKTVTQPS